MLSNLKTTPTSLTHDLSALSQKNFSLEPCLNFPAAIGEPDETCQSKTLAARQGRLCEDGKVS